MTRRSPTFTAFAASFVLALALLALPAAAAATPVLVRVESYGSTLVPTTTIDLPTAPVAPAGDTSGNTCPADSVIGAIAAVTNGNWNGTWSAQTGWSLDQIKGVSALPSSGRRWVVLINGVAMTAQPCQQTLAAGDKLEIYPACIGATSQCFGIGVLELVAPSAASPGARVKVQAFEIDVKFDSGGNVAGSQATPSTNAVLTGPDGTTMTDQYYGYGEVTLNEHGPQTVTVSKIGRVFDQATICVTDGADGYCGTQIPYAIPFNPLDFCTTNGSDGYCQTVDKTPPVGHITIPAQGKAFTVRSAPTVFKGTVDLPDFSGVAGVKLRLYRKATVTVTKIVKRKVRDKKTHKILRDKKTHKPILKKVKVKSKKSLCLSWNATKANWTVLKRCDPSLALQFDADGTVAWSYEFLSRLPGGQYTFDALASDGAGNVDSTPEVGRNRVTFTIK